MRSQDALPEVVVRTARPEDVPVCRRICNEAFAAITSAHGFPSDFPEPEVANGLLAMMFSNPGMYSFIAESGGRIVGSTVMDERSVIGGVGPLTIDPSAQNLGVGRKFSAGRSAVRQTGRSHGQSLRPRRPV